ncbi:MAG: TerD family protein [Bdellovibrionales bacterium]
MNLMSYLEFDNPQQNLLAGLGWDENPDGKGFFKQNHDLDFCCCLMSSDLTLIDFISPQSPKRNEYRLQVMHSGDHQTGDAPGEDEELHFNLKKLDSDIHYIVFLVRAKKGTDFRDVQKPYCTFLDGSTYKKFLDVDLQANQMPSDFSDPSQLQYVPAVMKRWLGESLDGDSWTLLPVEKFIGATDNEGADFFEVKDVIEELYQV